MNAQTQKPTLVVKTMSKEKTLVVVLSLDLETSSNRGERYRAEREKQDGIEEGDERKIVALGTGMRFNRVAGQWVVALLSRFGRADLSGVDYFFDSDPADALILKRAYAFRFKPRAD